MTSTPALAAAVEYLKHYTQGPVNLSDPVVGYSIAYPVSVLGMITTIYLVQRWWKIDYAAEARKMRGVLGMAEPINNVTVRVTNARAVGRTVPDLVSSHGWKVIFGRIKRGEGYAVAGGQTCLQADDLITVVGTPEELARVTSALGELALEEADLDRHDVDMRRMFISSPRVAGRRLRELQLPQRFGAVITRVRRGDSELLPTADMVLELGDRVRVLSRREHMAEVARYLGDSYRALSELDISTFSFGLALGIFLGLVPIPLPGGITIKLGLAGGPMIVALGLSALNRTGPIVWGLPYSANLMLRQLGLILFLAAVGTRSGYEFGQTLLQGQGFTLLGAALVVVVLTGLVALWLGYKVLKIPFGFLVGLLAGTQTQAATLGFCLEQSGDELPNVGYAEVYAASMIVKIIIVQLIFTFLM
jgi:putative transport protein